MPVENFCHELGLPFDESVLKRIADETRIAGMEIISAKGATYYGIGAALARIVSVILRDENAVLAVSSLAPASMGLGEVFLSLPAIINRNGVARVLPIPLNATEKRALDASACILKKHFASLDAGDAGVGAAQEHLQKAL